MAFDPLSAAGMTGIGGLLGTAVSLFGSLEAMPYENKIASDQSQVALQSKNIAAQEMNINNLRQQQMGLNTQRSQMESLRNLQRAHASGLASAVSGGAQYSSALGGMYGSLGGQQGTQALNLSQNLGIGNSIFAANNTISGYKMNIAGLQSDIATNQGQASIWQGIAGMGQGIAGASGSIGKLFGQSS